MKIVPAVREHRSITSHNDHVDVASNDNDVTSCGQSTPGGSKQCSVVTMATVAMPTPPYDVVVVDCGSDEQCTVTLADQQVRVRCVYRQ